MEQLKDRVAVVTGGGSGIGEALVRGLAGEGMHVVVADIEPSAAQAVVDSLDDERATAVHCDVADPRSVRALADGVWERFGACHVLCNNAGVMLMGAASEATPQDAEWLFGVNVQGVVNGIAAFVPRMRAQGEGHIVNTSSVAALGGGGLYGASKAAVMALSESLREELADDGIGVSVLCPSYVNSKILDAQRNRPAELGERAAEPMGTDEVTTGLPPSAVAEDTIAAIREDRLYVFTLPAVMMPRTRPPAEERFQRILEAIHRGERPNPWEEEA